MKVCHVQLRHSEDIESSVIFLLYFTLKVSKTSQDPVWKALQTAHEDTLLFTTKISQNKPRGLC